MWRITLKPILIFVCSVICALYLWGHQPLVTAKEPSSPALATPQPPHLPISPSPTNPMDTTSQPTLGDHRDGVVSVVFSPDGRLATGETDGMARIWDAQGRLLMTIQASDHKDAPVGVVLSPDGTKLATGDRTGTIKIWGGQGRLLMETQGRDIVFSPNSALVAVPDQTIKLWNTQTWQWQEFRDPHEDVTSLSLKFSPDSSRLVTYNIYNIKLWTTQGQLLADPEAINVTEANKLRNSDNPWAGYFGILAVAFSPDGDKIVVLDYVLDAQGQIIGRLEQPKEWGYPSLASSYPQFSPDGRKLIATNTRGAIGYVWNSHGQLLLDPFSAGEYGYAVAGIFSPDSSRLLTNARLQNGDTLKLWNSQGEQLVLVANLEGHQGKVWTMAFSPDSRLLATIDNSNVRLWDRQGEILKTFPNKQDEHDFTLKLQFSPDSSRLISQGIRRKKSNQTFTLNIWDVSDL